MDKKDLQRKMCDASKKGPKIHISCSRGKILSYKKLDNIEVVAFIVNNRNEEVSKKISGKVVEVQDSDVDFNLNDFLMLPNFSTFKIRIEVRRLKTKKLNG